MMPASATISAQGNGYALIFNWDPTEQLEVVPNVANDYAVFNSTVLKDAAGTTLACQYEPSADPDDFFNVSLYGYGLIPQGWTFEAGVEYTLSVPEGAFGDTSWENSNYVKGVANPAFTVVFTTSEVVSITEGTGEEPSELSYIEPIRTYVQELGGVYSVVFKMFEDDDTEAFMLEDNYAMFNKASLTDADGNVLSCKFETGANNDNFFDFSTIGYAFAPQGWTFEADTEYVLNVPAGVFGDEAWYSSNGVAGVCNQGMKVTFTTTEVKNVEYVEPGDVPVVPAEVAYDFISWSGSVYYGDLANPEQTEGFSVLLDWPEAAYQGDRLTPVLTDINGDSVEGAIVTGGLYNAREPKAYGWYISGIEEGVTYKLEVKQATVGNELWKENNGTVGNANPPLDVTFSSEGVSDVAVGEVLAPVAYTFNPVEAPVVKLTNFNMQDAVELTFTFDNVVYMIGNSDETPALYGWTVKDETGFDVDCDIQGVWYPSGNGWRLVTTEITGLDFRKEGKYVVTVPEAYFGNRVWARHDGMFGECNLSFTVEIDPYALYTADLQLDFTPTATKFEMTDVPFDVYDKETGKVVDVEYVHGLVATLTYDAEPYYTPAADIAELKELGFGLYDVTSGDAVDCNIQFLKGEGTDLKILFSDLTVDLSEGDYTLKLPMNIIGTVDWWMSWASKGRCNPTDYIAVKLPVEIVYTFEPLIRVTHEENYVYTTSEGTETIPSSYHITLKFPDDVYWVSGVVSQGFTKYGMTLVNEDGEEFIPSADGHGPVSDYSLFNIYLWGFPEDGATYTFTIPAGLFGDTSWYYDTNGALANPTLVIPIETVTGVEAVTVDALNGVEAVYNLNGVKVDTDNLTPGVYVRVANGTATKVLVK